MQADTLFIDSLAPDDTHQIHTLHWKNPAQNAPVIHICHGMAEYAQRYQPIAEALVAQGYTVFAHDHRGHGGSIAQEEDQGHYADSEGWHKTKTDILAVHNHIRSQLGPNTDINLLGHSMGSFIAMHFALEHGSSLKGLVLSGSNLPKPMLMKVARLIAAFERWRQGNRGKSVLLDKLSFGAFNKAFKPARTEFDWLSRAPEEVDSYISDPLCGFMCSNQLWLDFLAGLANLGQAKTFRALPNDLPMYLFSGSLDPVSASTDGINKLAARLSEQGQQSVTHRIYEDGRHEMFNETNRSEVINDLLVWLKEKAGNVPEIA